MYEFPPLPYIFHVHLDVVVYNVHKHCVCCPDSGDKVIIFCSVTTFMDSWFVIIYERTKLKYVHYTNESS